MSIREFSGGGGGVKGFLGFFLHIGLRISVIQNRGGLLRDGGGGEKI